MPFQPVQGRDNLENFIGNFIGTWTETQWDIITILSNGNLVIAERLDRAKAGEKSVDLPCVGMFEMENGKIKVWRDYFDSGTYFKAIS